MGNDWGKGRSPRDHGAGNVNSGKPPKMMIAIAMAIFGIPGIGILSAVAYVVHGHVS